MTKSLFLAADITLRSLRLAKTSEVGCRCIVAGACVDFRAGGGDVQVAIGEPRELVGDVVGTGTLRATAVGGCKSVEGVVVAIDGEGVASGQFDAGSAP